MGNKLLLKVILSDVETDLSTNTQEKVYKYHVQIESVSSQGDKYKG